MGHNNDFGYRSFPGMKRGTLGKPSRSPSDFFTNNGRKWEQSFFCLNCGRKLYPTKTTGYYLYRKLLCADCLKLWKEKEKEKGLTLLATGKIAGVAGSWVDLTELKKLGLRKRVYHNEHR